MDLSYFHSHPEDFYRYYEILRAIDLYLVENAGKGPEVWDTVNERSLFLTGDEKFLLSAEGGKLLNKINITLEDLHCYKVAEPFFYRLLADDVHHAGEIYGLIIENKDTFETFSRLQGEGYLCLSPLVIYSLVPVPTMSGRERMQLETSRGEERQAVEQAHAYSGY